MAVEESSEYNSLCQFFPKPGSHSFGPAKRQIQTVIVKNKGNGLGIQIIGGIAEEEGDKDFGIFVRSVLKGGVIETTGAILEGDQIIAVNGQVLLGVTNKEAVDWLREASNGSFVEFVISRDQKAKSDFSELINNYTYSHTHYFNEPSLPCYGSETRCVQKGSNTVMAQPHNKRQLNRKNKKALPLSRSRSTSRCRMAKPRRNSNGNVGRTSKANATISGAGGFNKKFDKDLRNLRNNFDVLKVKSRESLTTTPKPRRSSLTLEVTETPSDSFEDLITQGQLIPRLLHSLGKDAVGLGALHPQRQYVPINPEVRLPIYRLESALSFLGIDLKPENRIALYSKVHVDEQGCVKYGEFVNAARTVFMHPVQSCRNLCQSVDARTSTGQLTHEDDQVLLKAVSAGLITEQHSAATANTLLLENKKLQNEIFKLKMELINKEKESNASVLQVMASRKDVEDTLEEARAMLSRAQLVEQAALNAKSVETDYTKLIDVLESEIQELRAEKSQNDVSSSHRVAVLACQLRKTDSQKRSCQAAANKLLDLTEMMLAVLNAELLKNREEMDIGRLCLLQRKAQSSFLDAKQLMTFEELPFGWEVAYTSEGQKYYINHLKQTTTWHRPERVCTSLPDTTS